MPKEFGAKRAKVEKSNPQYEVLIQEQLGGGNGSPDYKLTRCTMDSRLCNCNGDLVADLLSNIASEQRTKVVYEDNI